MYLYFHYRLWGLVVGTKKVAFSIGTYVRYKQNTITKHVELSHFCCVDEPDFPRRILFTDEAKFTREGVFNSRNSHVWADENPNATRPHAFQQRYGSRCWWSCVPEHGTLIRCLYWNRWSPQRALLVSGRRSCAKTTYSKKKKWESATCVVVVFCL